jgi:hypothetical protein
MTPKVIVTYVDVGHFTSGTDPLLTTPKQNQPEKSVPLLVRLEHEAECSGDLTMMPKWGHYIATFFSPERGVVVRKLLWSVLNVTSYRPYFESK